jgi:hypothetical protein
MPACILFGDVYSATVVCWWCGFTCVLMFCMVILYGFKYRILEIEQYFVHLFILLVHAVNMEFFMAVHMSVRAPTK